MSKWCTVTQNKTIVVEHNKYMKCKFSFTWEWIKLQSIILQIFDCGVMWYLKC